MRRQIKRLVELIALKMALTFYVYTRVMYLYYAVRKLLFIAH